MIMNWVKKMSVRETFCHYFGVVLHSSREKKEATSRQSVNVISRGAATFSRKPPVFVPEPKPYLALKRCEEGRHLRRRPLSRKCNCGTGPEVSGLFPSARRQLCIPDVWTEVSLAAPVKRREERRLRRTV